MIVKESHQALSGKLESKDPEKIGKIMDNTNNSPKEKAIEKPAVSSLEKDFIPKLNEQSVNETVDENKYKTGLEKDNALKMDEVITEIKVRKVTEETSKKPLEEIVNDSTEKTNQDFAKSAISLAENHNSNHSIISDKMQEKQISQIISKDQIDDVELIKESNESIPSSQEDVEQISKQIQDLFSEWGRDEYVKKPIKMAKPSKMKQTASSKALTGEDFELLNPSIISSILGKTNRSQKDNNGSQDYIIVKNVPSAIQIMTLDTLQNQNDHQVVQPLPQTLNNSNNKLMEKYDPFDKTEASKHLTDSRHYSIEFTQNKRKSIENPETENARMGSNDEAYNISRESIKNVKNYDEQEEESHKSLEDIDRFSQNLNDSEEHRLLNSNIDKNEEYIRNISLHEYASNRIQKSIYDLNNNFGTETSDSNDKKIQVEQDSTQESGLKEKNPIKYEIYKEITSGTGAFISQEYILPENAQTDLVSRSNLPPLPSLNTLKKSYSDDLYSSVDNNSVQDISEETHRPQELGKTLSKGDSMIPNSFSILAGKDFDSKMEKTLEQGFVNPTYPEVNDYEIRTGKSFEANIYELAQAELNSVHSSTHILAQAKTNSVHSSTHILAQAKTNSVHSSTHELAKEELNSGHSLDNKSAASEINSIHLSTHELAQAELHSAHSLDHKSETAEIDSVHLSTHVLLAKINSAHSSTHESTQAELNSIHKSSEIISYKSHDTTSIELHQEVNPIFMPQKHDESALERPLDNETPAISVKGFELDNSTPTENVKVLAPEAKEIPYQAIVFQLY